jgi:hypothetical protein
MTVHHGNIPKRGHEELRTALVQVVMGMRRLRAKTVGWCLMRQYEAMKKSKRLRQEYNRSGPERGSNNMAYVERRESI